MEEIKELDIRADEAVIMEDTLEEEMDIDELEEYIKSLANPKSSEPKYFASPREYDENMLDEVSSSKEFLDGVKYGEYFAGLYTTLVNFGVSLETANEMIMNEQAIKHSMKLQEISAITEAKKEL